MIIATINATIVSTIPAANDSITVNFLLNTSFTLPHVMSINMVKNQPIAIAIVTSNSIPNDICCVLLVPLASYYYYTIVSTLCQFLTIVTSVDCILYTIIDNFYFIFMLPTPPSIFM